MAVIRSYQSVRGVANATDERERERESGQQAGSVERWEQTDYEYIAISGSYKILERGKRTFCYQEVRAAKEVR